MPTLCDTIDTLAMVYLDDELAPEERRELELHLHECTGCRDHVGAERKGRVELRALLAPPPAPALLRARIDRALDAADRGTAAEARRGALTRWFLPGTAVAAAAAALALFVAIQPATDPPRSSIAQEAVKVQRKTRPLEVQGASTGPWLRQHYAQDVTVPSFDDRGVRLVGARLVQVRDYDAAQIFYEVVTGPTRVELVAFVMKGVRDGDLQGTTRVPVDTGELWVTEMGQGEARASVVSYVDAQRNGYVFLSHALGPRALLDVVVESDLVRRSAKRLP